MRKQATFTLEEELLDKLKELSKETYIPQARIVELGIKEILKKYNKGQLLKANPYFLFANKKRGDSPR